MTTDTTGTDRSTAAALPVVAPRGELDAESLGRLRADLREAYEAHGGVVLDAAGIVFADSSFLRALVSTHQRTDLRIAAAPRHLLRMLALTGVGSVLAVYPTVRDAQAEAA